MSSRSTPTYEQLAEMLAESPFHRMLGLRLESTDQATQTVVSGWAFGPNLERAPGSGHRPNRARRRPKGRGHRRYRRH